MADELNTFGRPRRVLIARDLVRADGVSLQEIGAGRVKIEKTEEGDVMARHIDDIDSNEKVGVERSEQV